MTVVEIVKKLETRLKELNAEQNRVFALKQNENAPFAFHNGEIDAYMKVVVMLKEVKK